MGSKILKILLKIASRNSLLCNITSPKQCREGASKLKVYRFMLCTLISFELLFICMGMCTYIYVYSFSVDKHISVDFQVNA